MEKETPCWRPLLLSVWDCVAYSLWSCGKIFLHSKKLTFRGAVLWSFGGRDPQLKISPCISMGLSCLFSVVLWSCGKIALHSKKITLRGVVLWSCGGRDPMLKNSFFISVGLCCLFSVVLWSYWKIVLHSKKFTLREWSCGPVEEETPSPCISVGRCCLFSVVLWSCGKTALHSKKNNFEGSCPVVLWRKRTPVEDLSMYPCISVGMCVCSWENKT